MKMRLAFCFFILSFLPLIVGCSTSQEAVKDTHQKEYVFDQAPADTVKNISIPTQPEKDTVYIVQIGAFNTEEKAVSFSDEAKKKLKRELTVYFSSTVNLFVVQLTPFKTRKEAEEVRNNIWRQTEYSDAFIITEQK